MVTFASHIHARSSILRIRKNLSFVTVLVIKSDSRGVCLLAHHISGMSFAAGTYSLPLCGTSWLQRGAACPKRTPSRGTPLCASLLSCDQTLQIPVLSKPAVQSAVEVQQRPFPKGSTLTASPEGKHVLICKAPVFCHHAAVLYGPEYAAADLLHCMYACIGQYAQAFW